MSSFNYIPLFILIFVFSIRCNKPMESTMSWDDKKLFSEVLPNYSGVGFANNITESYEKNYYKFVYVYNGGGVAVGDINNDGLADIYFSGNEVPNKLYLNKGGMQFEDVTEQAGVAGDQGWYTGISMVDINGDGLLDIYACKSDWQTDQPAQRSNQLFINNGDLTFTEKATNFGLADQGFSIQASFFDYDNDGDLDAYLTNHPYEFELELEERLERRNNPEYAVSDRLYRNDNGVFKDVSLSAGIKNYGHGLGIATLDINNDGWLDVYVTNDFKEPDYCYLNNGDGTFSNQTKKYFAHIPFYAMGVDAADINNDGLEDIFITEMLPKDYKRSKTNMAPMNVQVFESMQALGLHHQYMHNTLQLNRGTSRFSEVAQMSGISKTDWSWTCLLSDLDNDGYRDIFVANGFKRDVFNRDFKKEAAKKAAKEGGRLDVFKLYEYIPSTKLPNFVFKNNGDLTFEDKSKAWGMDTPNLSQGGAVADLDNDGDLDLVLNNLDEPAQVFQNNAEKLNHHFLRVALKGHPKNTTGIGAIINLKYETQIQTFQMKVTRGFQSSSDHIAHFGLGDVNQVDMIEVIWPDGHISIQENVAANQLVSINYQSASAVASEAIPIDPILVDNTALIRPNFQHKETKFNDYHVQVLLPHKLSQLGPFTSVADVNSDGLEDFYVGGATNQPSALYLQQKNGTFLKKNNKIFTTDKAYEDMHSCFFDADQDGDIDLYVVSGGTEHLPKSKFYQDRLYLNDGQGNFKRSEGLPLIESSGSCVQPSDYDNDGDIDLFVGGRVFPNHYPYPTPSYLLQNNNGQFVDIAFGNSPDLSLAGMVTAAVWSDIDEDGDDDLIVVGEWMSVKVLKNDSGFFKNATNQYGLENTVGWWNKIIKSDYDNDGDMDFIIGNLGLNHKFHASKEEPFHVYCSDFDQNGSFDIVLAKYDGENQVPVRGRECSSEQMPFIAEKFPTYKSFADAKINDILGQAQQNSLHYEAQMFESIILEKTASGFEIKPLPRMAQIAPINGIINEDFDGDGNKEILVAGNMYQTEAETTRADASIGLMLKMKDGQLKPTMAKESGFFVPEDVKDIQTIRIGQDGKIGILVGINDGQLKLFTSNDKINVQ